MEFVYVVPRRELFRSHDPQGFHPFRDAAHRAAVEETVRSAGFFVERDHAERNPDLKQIIPYTLVTTEGRVLLMRRLSQGGETRLHGKLSVGVGGHINPEDSDAPQAETPTPSDPIGAGTRREIEEELEVRGSYDIQALGFLNDDSNPVGAVHLGWVQFADVKGTVAIREKDVLEGTLATPDELSRRLTAGDNFETWSSLLIERLDELLPHLQLSRS